jgi:hypothetical protein
VNDNHKFSSLAQVAENYFLLEVKITELNDLRHSGCKIDICCYMVTKGQSGPELDIKTMQSLCNLGLNIWWDV